MSLHQPLVLWPVSHHETPPYGDSLRGALAIDFVVVSLDNLLWELLHIPPVEQQQCGNLVAWE